MQNRLKQLISKYQFVVFVWFFEPWKGQCSTPVKAGLFLPWACPKRDLHSAGSEPETCACKALISAAFCQRATPWGYCSFYSLPYLHCLQFFMYNSLMFWDSIFTTEASNIIENERNICLITYKNKNRLIDVRENSMHTYSLPIYLYFLSLRITPRMTYQKKK